MEGRSISVRPFSSGPPGVAGVQVALEEAPQLRGPGRAVVRAVAASSAVRPPPRDDSNRTLYVGNLPYDIEEADLRGIFNQMGANDLDRIHLPMDHATGRKRGFAFVSFISEDAAKTGLEVVGDLNIRGRQCTVHIAHPRGERPAGGGPGAGGMRPDRPAFGGGWTWRTWRWHAQLASSRHGRTAQRRFRPARCTGWPSHGPSSRRR